MHKLLKAALGLIVVLATSSASATHIVFSSVPTDTTYEASGLLLGSSTGSYTIGGCGGSSPGCLGNGGSNMFSGTLTFRFVTPGTTSQSHVGSFTMVTCEGCYARNTSADVFDSSGALLTTIDMDVNYTPGSTDLAQHTFSYSAMDIGSIQVHLGVDAVESLDFEPGNAVPEPASVSLLGFGLAGLLATRRKTGKR